MQEKELSKISPVAIFILAVSVVVSTAVGNFVSRLFVSSDSITNDHFTLANLSKTVESIIISVDGKVDEKVYQSDQRNINEKLTAIDKKQDAMDKKQDAMMKMMEAIVNRQQASID